MNGKGKKNILGIILTIAILGQIILCIFFYNIYNLDLLVNIGWLILILSALLGWLPIFVFKKRGNVEKGKGYIHTTKLVKTIIYTIVRLPQYLSGILISIGLSLISQYWVVIILAVISIIIFYISSLDEEKESIEKFDEEY